VTAAPTKPVKVFYSYAHEDAELLEKLKTHLAGLKQRKLISEWHDGEISAGTEWNEEILKQLESAAVILLLISPDFINSDYSNNVEVKKAIERHKEGTARVIPIILRPVDWDDLAFSNLKALPADGRPVTRWPNRDEAFLDITKGIVTAIGELNLRAASSPDKEIAPRLSPLSYIEPQSAVGFVPRKDRDGNDIIDQLRGGLAPGSSRVIALWGAGGVGKTALAAEAVRSLIDDYQQRIAWVSADGREEFDLPNLLDEISGQLGRPELRTLTLEAKKHAVHELVTEKPSLTILDNFETVRPKGQSDCLEWLTRVSPSSVLITTRARIGRAAMRSIPIEPMLASEASEFLDRLIQQAQHRGTFEGIDKRRLIQTSEANPLILQWVFAQIVLAQDWREVLDELAQGEGDAAHRVFGRSFNLPLLNKGGRAALLALSLFVPSASRSALAEVAGLSGEKNKKKFREATKHLAALWLIRTTEDGNRLTVEGLTRDLAKARLNADLRRDAINERFVKRFLDFVNANSNDTASDLNALESERENLLTGIDIAFGTNNWSAAIAIYISMSSFLYFRGYWDEAIARGEKVKRSALAIKNKYALASIAESIAILRTDRGEYEEAQQIYDEVLPVFRELKDDRGIAITLYNLGRLESSKGEMHRARQCYQESLEIGQRLGYQPTIAIASVALGGIAQSEGDIGEARRLFSSGLEMHEKLGNLREVATAMSHLGNLDELRGEMESARNFYLKSLEIENKMSHQRGVARTLLALCRLATEQGEITEASKFAKESLIISKRLGSQGAIAASLHALGVIAYEEGNIAEARRLYLESFEINTRLGNKISLAGDSHELGSIDLDEGNFEGADAHLTRSLDVFRYWNTKILLAECLETMGSLRKAQGRFKEAEAIYSEALEIADALGQKLRIATVKHCLGLLEEKKNCIFRAVELFRESLELFEQIGSPKAVKVREDLYRLENDVV